jgi:cold-inducible RNA-binding protein
MNGSRPRLYVGNLPYQLTLDDLKEFFAGAGNVTDAAIITDRDTGRSKGFGFVEFATDDDAVRAQGMFNGAQFKGRTLKVDLAKPRQDHRDGNNRGGNDRSSGGGSSNFG